MLYLLLFHNNNSFANALQCYLLIHCLPCFYAAVTGAACLSLLQYKHFLSINSLFLEEVCTFSRILRHNHVRKFHNVKFFFRRWMGRRGKAEYPPGFPDFNNLGLSNATSVMKTQEHRRTGDTNNSVYRHFTLDNTRSLPLIATSLSTMR